MYAASAAIQNPKTSTILENHASILTDLATDLGSQTARLSHLLDRLAGPEPTTGNTGGGGKELQPSGVIYVSQFAAQRIRVEINQIAELIGRLENLV